MKALKHLAGSAFSSIAMGRKEKGGFYENHKKHDKPL